MTYLKMKLLSIDAWRCHGDWFWNNWFLVEDDIFIAESELTTRKLLKLLRDDIGVLSEASKGKVTVEDDGYNFVVISKGTREPLFALCYGEYV